MCLNAHSYPGFEPYPGFDHIWDMTFTWNIRNLVIRVSVYMILTLSRFLIISVQLYVDFSPSQPLHSVICTSKVCSETWIRCLHATVSWFLLEYIQVIKPYPGFWNQGKVFTGAKCNQDTPKTMLRVAEQVDPKQPIQSRTKAPTTVNWKLGLK